MTTLSQWAEEEASVGDILRALETLRRPEPMPATRTSVMTLVIVASTTGAALRAAQGVHRLGGRHPGRLLVLVLDQGAGSGIDASVELFGSETEGHPVWFEDIRLHVRGGVSAHLDSLIEPFTLPDVPVVVWFADGLPHPDDPILRAADVAMVDAREFGDTACFQTLSTLRPKPVIDLSWHRLRPWRVMLAGLFDDPERRPFLEAVTSVAVSGLTGPRHLLGGWLVDRLGVSLPRVHLTAAEHVSIRLSAVDRAGVTGDFAVERTTDARVVVVRAKVGDGPHSQTEAALPNATAEWGLTTALSALERDPVFERAVDAALLLGQRDALT